MSQGFLKAEGKKIVDGNGNEVLLRGIGLGGWMLQESYMMQTSGFANTQHAIQNTIASLIGDQKMQEFYSEWRANHCTKADVDSLKSWGFNSIRLPMHYNLYTLPIEKEAVQGENTWIDEGFRLTDSLLKWCGENQMYLILDLHAAPGGQGKDAAISDYDPSKPSLWESTYNKQKMMALWVKLADRYKDEPWLGAYDIINEPNWSFTSGGNQNGCSENSNAPLRLLLEDVTDAIRTVDTKHIVIIEGNCWGNNYNGIFPLWDDNMVLSFHKYWSGNDQGSISGIMQLRNQYNVPIWCGESGENSNVWFTEAIRLFESNDIGWAWWPLKKIGSVVDPLTIPVNSGYQTLINYWSNGGTKPTVDFAYNSLIQQAKNSNITNCIFNKDVPDAMIRQVNESKAIPYKEINLPGVIHFTDFDLGRSGAAYLDLDSANYGSGTDWNNGWIYRNDAVDISKSIDNDILASGYHVGWTQKGEWLQYTVTVDSTAVYELKLRYSNSSGNTAKLRCKADGSDITSVLELATTGGSGVWKNLNIQDIALYKGVNQLRFYTTAGGADLSYAQFSLSKPIEKLVFKPVIAVTSGKKQQIELIVNKPFNTTGLNMSDFDLKINNQITSVKSVAFDADNPRQINIAPDYNYTGNDIITITYKGSSLHSADGSALPAFSDYPVINDLPEALPVPGKIEAEAYETNVGLKLESCSDIGGGQNIGFTNPGDYLIYRIYVKDSGNYDVVVREACLDNPGKIEIQQLNSEYLPVNSVTVDMPVTGGWQTWQDVYSKIKMDNGPGFLKIRIIDNEFNLNWYKFSYIKPADTTSGNNDAPIYMYPNPVHDKLNLVVPNSIGSFKTIKIHDANGRLVSSDQLQRYTEEYEQPVNELTQGFYIIEVEVEGKIWRAKMLKI